MSPCLVCLGAADADYHPRCARRLFGTSRLPRVEIDQASLSMFGVEMGGRVSLSGVQRKLGLGMDGGTLHVGAGSQRFILKPQIQEFEQVPENEHLTLRLARMVGLATPEHGLMRLRDNSLALLIVRFDRTAAGRRIPMEDFCQLAGLQPGDKYKGSAELCARLLQRYSAEPPVDLARLLRLLLFSWWCGNGDLHLKNLSLLTLTPGEPRLSPCYDLVNTAILYPDDPLALPVAGKHRNFSRQVWHDFAEYGGLAPGVVAFEARRLLKQEAGMLELVARSRLDGARREAYASVMRARRGTLAALT